MNIESTVKQLLNLAIEKELIQPTDEIYARNQILDLLNLDEFTIQDVENTISIIPVLLDVLNQYAVENGIIADLLDEKEIFSSQIMNVFMPKPSELNKAFYDKYEQSPIKATDYFYQLSQDSNYIQTERVNKNISYQTETEYGALDITINLSKPEKDPKEIALEKERKMKSSNYPTCLLCVENEGYAGRIGHPARSNHRMVRLNLQNEEWFLQYSPYVYYNEHCIVLCGEHRDMMIGKETFERLLEFVEQYPHYFVGSNADLPIVGGSILTHDHYQGGRYEFAMAKAEVEESFKVNNVDAAIVKWPMSVIRLSSTDKLKLIDVSTEILEKWKQYSDKCVDIVSHSGETPHNTITPIARMRDGKYEVDLVLRNNRTTDEHPLGIFHPHADVHHIKKENIGLIEVMGLAVLPARLKDELIEVQQYLLDQDNKIQAYHVTWANELKEQYLSSINTENAERIVQEEVGKKFSRVLEDAGVFKRTVEGKEAFLRFVEELK